MDKEYRKSEELRPFRTQKDRMFRLLFADKKELLTLYNALNNTGHTDETELEITTLENAIYMSVKNDISCILDMNLYEHQSTVNPNLPLRDLDYVTRNFDRLMTGQDIYSPKPVVLPNPRFIVFYNGRQEQPARKEWRLSDLYRWEEESPKLELVVTQININPGYNDDLLERCPTLKGYVQYTECVRKHRREQTYAKAVELAVDECVREGILAEFLRRNKAEVVSMGLFEFDPELHDRTMREIGREEGAMEACNSSIRNLMKTMHWTLQQAMDALMIPEEEQEKYKAML